MVWKHLSSEGSEALGGPQDRVYETVKPYGQSLEGRSSHRSGDWVCGTA